MKDAKCQRDGCENIAESAIAACVPAKGWPIDCHKPLKLVMGLCCCRKCFDELDPEEFKSEDFRKLVVLMGRMSGSDIPPDIDRMFFERVSFDSKDYKVLIEARTQ